MIFLRTFLPNLSAALNISLLVVVYLDLRNPMMGFLVGWPFLILVCSGALCAVATAVVLYSDWRRGRYDKRQVSDRQEVSETQEIE